MTAKADQLTRLTGRLATLEAKRHRLLIEVQAVVDKIALLATAVQSERDKGSRQQDIQPSVPLLVTEALWEDMTLEGLTHAAITMQLRSQRQPPPTSAAISTTLWRMVRDGRLIKRNQRYSLTKLGEAAMTGPPAQSTLAATVPHSRIAVDGEGAPPAPQHELSYFDAETGPPTDAELEALGLKE